MASFASSATMGGARKHAWTNLLKKIIVYDNIIVNICFKVKAKKDNGQMRVKRTKNFRSRGDQNHGGGGLKILEIGGGQVSIGGDNPLMGVGPPPSPHIGKPCLTLSDTRLGAGMSLICDPQLKRQSFLTL